MQEKEQKKKFHFPFQGEFQWKNFFRLPMWIRTLIISGASLVLLTAVFFMAGNYLYSPQKVARDYYEALLSKDWNRMYDCCEFPEGQFLSRKNFVNTMSYGTSGDEESPVIKNYRMRKKATDESSKISTYEVTYTLEGISEAQKDTVEIARGGQVMGPFYDWYIVPEKLYASDVEVAVPDGAELYLDGIQILDKYEKAESGQEEDGTEETTEKAEESGDGETIYEIPYLFLGYHTVQLHQNGRDDYREIVYVKDDSRLEFLPELKLNDSTGKEITDLVEETVQSFCEAGMKKDSYSKVKKYFSSENTVQKKAEQAFQDFCDEVADEENTGLVNLAVTSIETTVSNIDGEMKVEAVISYTAERVEKRLFFFYQTVTESGTKTLDLQMKNTNGEWKIEKWS